MERETIRVSLIFTSFSALQFSLHFHDLQNCTTTSSRPKLVYRFSFSLEKWIVVSSNSIYHRRSSRSEVFCKTVSLRISQNSQENTCVSLFFNKVVGLRSKETLCHRYFPMNFAKFLRTTFSIEHCWWLLLSPGSTITRWLQSLGRNPYLRSFRCLYRSSYM